MADRTRPLRAASVTHRGPTLGYRITEGDASVCYIPDHEPALGAHARRRDEPEWISGYDLAHGATLLIHDCQYTDAEYPDHVGWGHSRLSDALTFARRVEAERLLLFHHDPLHSDDFLDALAAPRSTAGRSWAGDPARSRWRWSAARSSSPRSGRLTA